MRIVAGELGGRRLISPPAPRGGEEDVRPTAERTREAVFSMLGPLDGDRVLDLFCGSGALGLEALSRGASEVTLVDLDLTTATANVEALGVEDRVRLVARDAVAFCASQGPAYDLVLCDPPYRLAHRFGPELQQHLPARLRPGGRVVTESATGSDPLLTEPGFELVRERRYGTAVVRILEVASSSTAGTPATEGEER